MAPHNTEGLLALVSIIGAFAKRLINKESLDVLDIATLLFKERGDIKVTINLLKELPAEFWDIDSEEGQELALRVKNSFGDVNDASIVDEVLGVVMTGIPSITSQIWVIKNNPLYINKATALGTILAIFGNIVDMIQHHTKIEELKQ